MRRSGLMTRHVTALCSVLVACNDTGSLVGTPALSHLQDNKSVAMACSPELLPSNETNVGCCQDGRRMWATIDGHRMGYRGDPDMPALKAGEVWLAGHQGHDLPRGVRLAGRLQPIES
jgi:hypothetical protein